MTKEITLESNDEALTQNKQSHQQRKENREVITPYAFEVSPELFGTPLASPSRRACALLIDLSLVAMLSGVTGNALAIFIALLLWMSSRRILKERGRNYAVILLRVVASLLVLGGLLGFIFGGQSGAHIANKAQEKLLNEDLPISDESNQVAGNAIKIALLSGKYLLQSAKIQEQVEAKQCENTLVCWQNMAEGFTTDLVDLQLSESAEQDVLNTFLEVSSESLTEEEFANFRESLLVSFLRKKEDDSANEQVAPDKSNELQETLSTILNNSQSVSSDVETTDAGIENDINGDASQNLVDSNKVEAANIPIEASDISGSSNSSDSEYSLVNWIEGIITDLGLGFGWAAAYFTATMVWLKGQTVGKKLLRIKVIKLDGTVLNVWESFGRYGGYGAGLATGLMGFLQIFWDPNRQAIQDKISETLVVKTH